MVPSWARSTAVTILRIGGAVLFMEHGAQKLFGLLGGLGGPGRTAPLLSLLGAAGILEFFGGLLVAIGLFARPVAGILAAEMIVAFTTQHMPRGGWPVQNGGELALLYLIIFIALIAFGPGPVSADRLRGKR